MVSKRSVRSVVPLVLTLTVGLVVSGCGGGGSQSASTSGVNASDNGSGSLANAPKSITIAMADEQKTLDPTQVETRPLLARANQFVGTLTVANRDGTKVTPGLAESWRSSPQRWTFKLRPNLKFSDGTPLTAHDVAASLNYYKNRKDDVNEYILATFARARALNDRVVELDTSVPSPRLDWVLSVPFHPIVPADRIADPKAAKKFLANNLVSAGMYMVKSASVTKTVLVANPHYWGPKPVVDQVTWVTNADGAARLEQVKAGQVDYADDLPAQTAPQLTGDLHPSYVTDAFGAELLIMNTRAGAPTHSLALRQAISAALDRKQISDVLYSGKVPAQLGIFPASSNLSVPFVKATPELDKAKALMAKSGCAAPCKVRINFLSSVPDFVQMAQLIAQQLSAIGIDVEVQRLDDAVFFDHQSKGDFDLIVTGPYGFYAEDLMNYVFPTDGGGAGAAAGWKGADPYEKTWQSADGEAFDRVVKQVLGHIAEDMPFVPVVGVGYMGGSRVPDAVFSQSPLLYFPVGTKG